MAEPALDRGAAFNVPVPLAPVPIPELTGQPDVARVQHGAFTRHQATAAGYNRRAQHSLIAAGMWVEVVGRVLRHRDVPADQWLRARAASLASGPHRVVSHSIAAALWGWTPIDEHFHVIRSDGITEPGLQHHRLPLKPADWLDLGGWRITGRTRTIGDLLCWHSVKESIDWAAEGFRNGWLEPRDLRRAAAGLHRRRGRKKADFVAESCRGRPLSGLEWEFHQLAWSVMPSGWEFNQPIRDHLGLVGIVDAVHAGSRLVVEVDGRAFHGDDRFQSDRSRDQRLVALGLRVVRFTWDDMTRNRRVVHRILHDALHNTP